MKSERDRIISAGVANLKAFGYPKVDKDNILTDRIYGAFFLSMLEENLKSAGEYNNLSEEILKELIGTVQSAAL